MLAIPERIPDETEVYRRMMEGAAARLRVACPGIIQEFDAGRQVATVQMAIREKVNLNGNQSWVDLPLLLDVPVYFPRAGGYCVTMPVVAGDECLVIFGDMSIDAWWQSGGVQNQVEKRRHALSDGFALVGIWSQPRKVVGYSAATAQLRNEAGSAYVEIAGNNVNIVADNVTVTATNYTVNAQHSNMSAGGNTVIEGRNFLGHTHPDAQGGNTGGVT